MTILRYISIFLLATLQAYGQAPQNHSQIELPIQAKIPVRELYRRLVSQQIEGFPTAKNMTELSPYLSNSLINRINQARSCHDDWFREHSKNDEKAPSTWAEFGLFSGADDRGHPQAFQIEKAESEKDGSFRVYVRLTEGPQEKPWNWQVAVVVMPRDGKFLIHDVIFLRDKDVETESRLSGLLTVGCDSSHWAAFSHQNDDQEQK